MDWQIFWVVFSIVFILNMFSIIGFVVIDRKIDRILEKIDASYDKMEDLSVKFGHVEYRLSKLESESNKKTPSAKKRTYAGAGYVL